MRSGISGVEKFEVWLNEADPSLARLFDYQRGTYNTAMVQSVLDTGDSSTIAMIRFVLGVWHGRNQFDFDLYEALPILSTRHHHAVISWISSPFWT